MSYSAPPSYDSQPSAPPEGLWPPGDYEGEFYAAKAITSGQKGTPGIEVDFTINGEIKTVKIWLTDATMSGMSGDQLRELGFNGEYPNVGFTPPEKVKLWMKHEEYKGKWKEVWNISTVRAADPAKVGATARMLKLWAARNGTPPPAPVGRPTVPALAAPPPPAAAPKAGPPLPPPPAAAEPPPITDINSAWAACVEVDPSGQKFWDAVSKVRDGAEGTPQEIANTLTPAEWEQVVRNVAPF